ncbi:DUF72 domain-containing protein [Maricaulis virginensis]|uniref:DUF72 domain-containing protein n=1 Tax=Maricaulis virginensis TaxID=144022 RepID=A0A9W6MN66_9PROT|nr:DUF72 domain-containing protein [Maricaulis virginensis]GLK51882.1 hypothetical protein GCM10017621_13900 [Maricaulis virginensis]
MTGTIRAGIGGWTYAPWRGGVFYPEKLSQKRELEYASRQMNSLEINGTYYSGFKPDTWMKWRDETPEDFVFAVKASRFCTNRKRLSEGGESIERFLDQGLTALGDKLGPINWQFMATKTFDPEDFEGFLKRLPQEKDGIRLRHALEVRSPTFDTEEFYDLARKYGAAIVYAHDDEAPGWPRIDQDTADFRYARLMSSREDEPTGLSPEELDSIAGQTRAWARGGDVFAYFIAGAKVRNPAAAQALLAKLGA